MVNVTFTPNGVKNSNAANTVKILSPDTVKQGDTKNDFLVQLIKDGVPLDLTGKTVTWSAASNKGKFVTDRPATVESDGTVGIEFTGDDVGATGSLRVEFKVTYADGDIEKFPAQDYAYFQITRSLDDLSHVPVMYASVQYFESKVTETQALAVEAQTAASTAEKEAADAKASALAMEAQIAQLATDGPVLSVNGQSGIVQGLATQQSVDGVTAQLAEKANLIPGFKKWVPKYKDTFGAIARWTNVGNSSLADDPDNFTIFGEDKRETGAIVKTQGTSIKMTKTSTTTANGQADCTLSQPIDISNHHALLKYFIHEGTGLTSYESLYAVTVMVFDNSGGWAYWTDAGISGDAVRFFPGWRTKAFRSQDYSTAATFDPTKVTKIRLWIQVRSSHLTSTPSVTFDSLEFIPKLKHPIPYVLTFDGGYINHKKALAYLAAKGIRAHVYPTFDLIGNPGRMTVSDLKQCEMMGHIVGFHERSALPNGFYTLSEQEKVTTVEQGIAWMNANGFKQGIGFAPLATRWWNDKDNLNILYPYLEHVRIGQVDNLVLHNPRIIGVAYDTNGLTLTAERTARQEAIDRGTMYAGCVHEMTTGFLLADFYTIVDEALADPRIKFVTMPELINTDWYGR